MILIGYLHDINHVFGFFQLKRAKKNQHFPHYDLTHKMQNAGSVILYSIISIKIGQYEKRFNWFIAADGLVCL